MTNREKFLTLVSPEPTKTLERNRWWIENQVWLWESQEVAIKILDQLEAFNWSQKDLAEKMGVSPQYINKIVKGKENLTLETLTRLQILLGIPLLASYYEAHTLKVATYHLEQTSVVPLVFATHYSPKQSKGMPIQVQLSFNADSSQPKGVYGN